MRWCKMLSRWRWQRPEAYPLRSGERPFASSRLRQIALSRFGFRGKGIPVHRPLLSDLAPLAVRLWDGTPVRLRPIRPGDETRVQQAYADLLSSESRLNRFWRKTRQMPSELAARLTDTDETGHVAWFALKPDDETFPGYGGASFWRHPDRPEEAEITFTIADDWQRHGFATLLLSILWVDGWRTGLRKFAGFCRLENQAMRAFWKSMGGREMLTPNACELHLDLLEPDGFVHQAAYEMTQGLHRQELAAWMQEWLAKLAAGA